MCVNISFLNVFNICMLTPRVNSQILSKSLSCHCPGRTRWPLRDSGSPRRREREAQLSCLRSRLFQGVGAAETPEDPLGRASVPVPHLQEELHPAGPHDRAPEDPHRGETLHLHRLQQELHLLQRPAATPAAAHRRPAVRVLHLRQDLQTAELAQEPPADALRSPLPVSALQQELQPGPRAHLPRGHALRHPALLLQHLQEEPEWRQDLPQPHEETRVTKVTTVTNAASWTWKHWDRLRGPTLTNQQSLKDLWFLSSQSCVDYRWSVMSLERF